MIYLLATRRILPRLLAALLLASGLASAQQTTITPNYKDADIRQVIEAVGEITGQNFVLDPRVKAQVTMVSSVPMTADAFYEAFLSILSVYGFVAVPSGGVVKILPDANARQVPGMEMTAGARRADDIVTQVIQVQQRCRRATGADTTPTYTPVRAPGGLPRFEHADHF